MLPDKLVSYYTPLTKGLFTGEKEQPMSPDAMRRWNKLIDFAKRKGYAGRQELDHDENLRKQIFQEYNKENPNDAVPIEIVKQVQNEIQTYKSNALKNIAANPDSYKGKPNNFMPTISQVDGIFGQKTSQWAFPEAYMQARSGQKELRGFAPLVPYNSLTQK